MHRKQLKSREIDHEQFTVLAETCIDFMSLNYVNEVAARKCKRCIRLAIKSSWSWSGEAFAILNFSRSFWHDEMRFTWSNSSENLSLELRWHVESAKHSKLEGARNLSNFNNFCEEWETFLDSLQVMSLTKDSLDESSWNNCGTETFSLLICIELDCIPSTQFALSRSWREQNLRKRRRESFFFAHKWEAEIKFSIHVFSGSRQNHLRCFRAEIQSLCKTKWRRVLRCENHTWPSCEWVSAKDEKP